MSPGARAVGESGAEPSLLRKTLRALVPAVDLVDTPIPLVPELRLWLMCDSLPEGPLPRAVMHALLDAPPYWAFCWGSGAVLARYVFDHPELVRGKSVLDFGSGSGIVAIAAARCGAARVVACDTDPLAREAVAANARHNGVALDVAPDYFGVDGDVDVLLAADVLYDVENMPFLDRFRQRSTTVVVADSRVRNFDAEGYERVWSAECRVQPDLVEAESVRLVTVFRAHRGTPFGSVAPLRTTT